MNKLALLTAMILGGWGGAVFASSQVQLSFTAEADPPPCHILQSPTTLDFGNINRNQLAAKTATQLPVKSFAGGITVQCESATSIGLRAVDNSGGSTLSIGNLSWSSPSVNVTPAQTDQRFGLGMTSGGKAIGVWNVLFHSAQVDGVPAQIGIANNGMLDLNDTAPTMRNNGKAISWVQNSAFALGELFTVQADAAVALAPLVDLPSGTKISFAGSATLEIVYL
ncbi:DUF1120 domain-containing protein [Hafnia alvei]|uniref:DUF1120 domain-containing protein n=1 Tax=Hafnia alvei TaxID=569 RepID=UPI00061D1F6D|nr:DUF1120 domain-containing protein [Hafnia alvei]KID06026.2 hypothetical protein PU01_02385 [Hafnia alvei]MBW3477254.1 DUF1120 domain-containing protein [Hafnia alvei]